MIDRLKLSGTIAAGLLAFQAITLASSPARTEEFRGNDLRDIRVGMAAAELGESGYVDFACASDPKHALAGWTSWRDCPSDASGTRAIRFGYDPSISRDGTMVAGHPAILTLLIDDSGHVTGLQIETDPKARLYVRKKAFLLGLQARSRYGSDGWACTQRQPDANEQPVGGLYVRESCTKNNEGRTLVVQRDLFRLREQNAKNFVSRTQATITREVN